jgi:hypothetical protein
MFGLLPIGPYRSLSLPDGSSFPWYIIPFDKNGYCDGPETRKALIEDVRACNYSDIYLFSHGWNNDWEAATSLYRRFIDGYMALHSGLKSKPPEGYRPLLIGIFWPSIILSTGDSVQFASDEAMDRDVSDGRLALAELAADVPRDPARFYELAQKPELSEDEARLLVSLVKSPSDTADDLPGLERLPTSELVDNAAPHESPEDLDKIQSSTDSEGTPAQTAGTLDPLKRFLPRTLLRLMTVRQMKDRAGLVGVRGGSPLLRDLRAAASGHPVRIHLIGHSYGCRLLLSALCAPEDVRVATALLLQPAISHLCFAERVDETGKPGGYRPALQRVAAPILCTFSQNDHPLHDFFHLALFRKRDLAEANIAAESGEPPTPSIYAALGGYGPRGCQEELLPVRLPAERYPLGDGHPVIGINATATISGHGDVANPSTWWALCNLVEWSWTHNGPA